MENEYVPINHSELINYLPPNEEVLYSTESLISINIHTVSSGVTYKDYTHRMMNYPSHLLITPLGFLYYAKPYDHKPFGEHKYADQLPTYNSLLNIISVSKRGFEAQHIDLVACYAYHYQFELMQNPSYESEAEFNNRLNKFRMVLYQYIKNATQNILDYLVENRDKDEKNYSPLWKVTRSILLDNFDPKLNEYLNSIENLQNIKREWRMKKRDFDLRKNYLIALYKARKKNAYKDINVAYLRPLIRFSDAEVETHFHLAGLSPSSTGSGITTSFLSPSSDDKYRSLFHTKTEKRLLKQINFLNKKIEKEKKTN